MESNKPLKIVVSIIALGFLSLIVLASFSGTIDAGERGVKTRLGNVVGTLDSGLYFKLPIIESVTKISIKTQTVTYEKENPLTSASKDLQDVQIATVVNYHIEPSQVENIYINYKTVEEFEEKVIRPEVRATIKAVASQYTAEELVNKRPEFSDKASFALNEQLTTKGIVIENANITDLQFSKSFSEAIEAKVTAVQNAEAAKNKLEQIKYEGEQTIVAAKAEAEAVRIKTQAINSQGGADYIKLQELRYWNGSKCTSYCYGNDVPLPAQILDSRE